MKNQEKIWDNLYRGNLTWKKESTSIKKSLEGMNVLEIGVGNGKTLKSIIRKNPKSVTAIDFSQEAINLCLKIYGSNSRLKIIKSDIKKLSLRDNEFDIVFCHYVLNNLSYLDRKKAISEIYRVLKKDGKVFFEDFSRGDLRQNKKRNDGLFCHFFSIEEIKRLFKSFDEISIKVKSFNPIKTHPDLKRKIIFAIVNK